MANTKRTKKSPATTTLGVEMSAALAAAPIESSDILDGLMAELNLAEDKKTEAITTDVDSIIESATIAAAEVLEREELYADQTSDDNANQPEGDRPQTTPEQAKTKRARKTSDEPAAAPKTPRVTYFGNRRSAVLDNRLGGETASFLVLEIEDGSLDADALKAKQDAFMDDLDNKLAKKVAEKCVMLLKDIRGKQTIKNEVMATAFKVLKRDGYLTSGDKGNLQLALRSKYSVGTARSQANQMFSLFPFLKITVKGEKGKMVPNEKSLLLHGAYNVLGLKD